MNDIKNIDDALLCLDDIGREIRDIVKRIKHIRKLEQRK